MIRWRVLPLAAGVLVIACGGRVALDDVSPGAGLNAPDGSANASGGSANAPGAGLGAPDASRNARDGASCISCQSNEDCQSTCSGPEGAAACCDLGSGTCFFTKASECPAVEDADAPMSPFGMRI
jgi:hypothetical protein